MKSSNVMLGVLVGGAALYLASKKGLLTPVAPAGATVAPGGQALPFNPSQYVAGGYSMPAGSPALPPVGTPNGGFFNFAGSPAAGGAGNWQSVLNQMANGSANILPAAFTGTNSFAGTGSSPFSA